MKKYILAAMVSVVSSSCSSIKYSEISSFLDYSIITDKGIKVSPFASASDNYVMIGEETMQFLPGYADRDFVKENSDHNIERKGYYGTGYYTDGSKFFTPTPRYVMEKFAAAAAEKGADAIFDFKSVRIADPNTGIVKSYAVSGVLAKEVE